MGAWCVCVCVCVCVFEGAEATERRIERERQCTGVSSSEKAAEKLSAVCVCVFVYLCARVYMCLSFCLPPTHNHSRPSCVCAVCVCVYI